MATPNKKLIEAIRSAALKINISNNYQWGHMGACNCGFLAQELSDLSKGQIHEYAMRGHGDWTEQVEGFCPTSNFPMDLLISELISNGLKLEDLINLERLKDKEVLNLIPMEKRNSLKHNSAKDVSLYMTTWADLLESKINEKLNTRVDLVLNNQ